MPSISAPFEAPQVWHYDGASALKRYPRFVIDDGTHFRLVDDDGNESQRHPLTDLVARERVGDDAVFGLKRQSGWRIGFPGGVPLDLRHALPGEARYGRLIDRFGLWPSVITFAVIAAVALFLFAQTPALVAQMVPPALERRIGDLMLGDFGGRVCGRPASVAALSRLTARLDAAQDEVSVQVVNLPLVNAVTLPGGRVLVFDGLLKQAGSADELAGVIGHELGHVYHRDVLESLLRQLGLSVLLGGLEGNIGGYTNALLSTAYSRSAEARADTYAIDTLNAAKISPAATADFFKRLGGKEDKPSGTSIVLNYLSTHPLAAGRATNFIKGRKAGIAYTPALSDADWQAVRESCVGQKTPVPELNF